ncbi:Vacuolar protein sorting/targeting protein 10 [Fusarium odoratissimum]|uniref:Vacuolar protein sorting/targeting protein 10 n=1 Tax=Fusarium oxysporum f. sp. cubense (strain race 4) TaxID=2502994 RepID=N1R7P9_FUSC4|nr:Vacuolar protein sorting/targeting protein 10 [Fusarium odoratissimum]
MMRSSAWAALSWRALIFSLLWTAVAAKQDKPTVDASVAKHPPLNLNYFEDSDVVVFQDIEERNIWRSEDAGKTWAQVPDIPDRSATFLYLHPFDSNSAFVLTKDRKHYKTEDRGKSWSEFNSGTMPSAFQPDTLVFHAGDPKRIIFNGMNCDGIFCDEETTYTIDGFKTVQQLRPSTSGCWWAKANREFTTGDAELDKTRILCIVTDPLSLFKTSQKLCVSDNFFAKGSGGKFDEFEPSLDGQRDVTGVVNIAAVKSFILLASSSAGSDEMTLFVTSDAQFWHRAMFPTDDSHDHSHKINQEAYTVLESTNYSIQVDVMTSHPSTPMGVIFTSNSNGTYFTENIPYTNRNVKGHVDFEKISGIQGIFLVNTVENGKDVDAKNARKVVVTQITFDDGRTFEPVKAGQDRIHLHSMTDIDNIGRIFSSPAPGLVMGNGNTGAALGEFESSNLYVSDNAGVSWKKALEGPHKYEFGDTGGILVAVRDSLKEDVDKISFSLDYGENWESAPLPDGLKVRPVILTTTQDSTSLKFLLVGEKDRTFHMIAINFEGMEKRTCESKDMESWYARVDDKGAATCIMGHKQTYNRRKKSADCFLKADFRDPEPVIENCECADADFECDYNFQRDPDDNKVCKKVGPVPIPEGSCKGKDETFKGSSGWRLIPGNTCIRKSGAQKDDPVERKCSDGGSSGGGSTPGTPASGEISLKINEFTDIKGQDMQKFYLMGVESESPTSEVVIARPIGEKLPDASISTDRGDNWKTLQRYATKCEFTGNSAFKFRAQNQIVCLVHKDENIDNDKTIVTIEDFSADDKIIHNGTVAAFATMNEFILATDEVIEDGKESAGLQAIASMDGKHFEAAQFPRNFHDSHSSLYTVLDSSNHAVNLFVATDLSEGRRRGSIIKSNSNGTTYVLSASNVNSDELGYVDFEKVAGLEGVTLINSVSNPVDKNGKKVIQTKISHNDGAEWGFLPPPSKGADGKSYSCSSSGDSKCALHLHHYTERENKGRTFSASTAVGLIFGYGNVGPSLGDVKDADTFMSADGGINWKSVKKGVWTWQYGDQGSIIVLAQRATHVNKVKSNIVSYSTDEGNTWTDYKFTDKEVTIQDLTSVHSGTSRNFLVWYQTDDKKLFAANLDFTGLTNQPCKYSDDSSSDYDLWSPKHPLQKDDCLFGHKAKYLRKKTDRKCYNQASMSRLRGYENCECTRRDFECAYNFELDNHGQCTLVPDHDAISGEEWCKQHPNETSYFDPTGYRRIPLTTCEGGQELDKTSTEHACAGHEEDFSRKRGASGWAIFFAIIIPIGLAAAFGWYAWRNWSGKFGQIRLGDNSATFDSEQPWIKYPVIAISALAAVVAALPLVLTSIWRSATGVYERVSNRSRGGNWSRRYTTRDSFARGRGDYSMVDDDEGELLGEESDEEV